MILCHWWLENSFPLRNKLFWEHFEFNTFPKSRSAWWLKKFYQCIKVSKITRQIDLQIWFVQTHIFLHAKYFDNKHKNILIFPWGPPQLFLIPHQSVQTLTSGKSVVHVLVFPLFKIINCIFPKILRKIVDMLTLI